MRHAWNPLVRDAIEVNEVPGGDLERDVARARRRGHALEVLHVDEVTYGRGRAASPAGAPAAAASPERSTHTTGSAGRPGAAGWAAAAPEPRGPAAAAGSSPRAPHKAATRKPKNPRRSALFMALTVASRAPRCKRALSREWLDGSCAASRLDASLGGPFSRARSRASGWRRSPGSEGRRRHATLGSRPFASANHGPNRLESRQTVRVLHRGIAPARGSLP